MKSDYLKRPILGFNVIQDDQQKNTIVNILKKSFGKPSKFQAIFK